MHGKESSSQVENIEHSSISDIDISTKNFSSGNIGDSSARGFRGKSNYISKAIPKSIPNHIQINS